MYKKIVFEEEKLSKYYLFLGDSHNERLTFAAKYLFNNLNSNIFIHSQHASTFSCNKIHY